MFEALLNELHAQLSSFVNDNPDIFMPVEFLLAHGVMVIWSPKFQPT